MGALSGELMNVREAARYLGINEKKIYFLAKAGQIPSTRVTGKWTFPKNLIDEWIERGASGNRSKAPALPNRAFLLAAGSDDPCLGILHDLYERETRSASFYMVNAAPKKIGTSRQPLWKLSLSEISPSNHPTASHTARIGTLSGSTGRYAAASNGNPP